MGVWTGIALAVAVLLAVAALAAIRLRALQGTVEDSWQQVLLAHHRRRGLAGELAEAARVSSGGQIDWVDRVQEAREVADLPGASPDQQLLAERDLDAALAALSDAVSLSPALLDDARVTALRSRLDDADRRIEARRSVYERSAYALRRRATSVPGRLIARALGIQPVSDEPDE